jgi:hypothetical protein
VLLWPPIAANAGEGGGNLDVDFFYLGEYSGIKILNQLKTRTSRYFYTFSTYRFLFLQGDFQVVLLIPGLFCCLVLGANVSLI